MAKTVDKADVAIPEGSNIKEVNAGYDGDKIVGYTVRITAKGFHGAIDMVVGISVEGKLGGIKILSHTETAGLGANINKDAFKGQFIGKPIDKPLEVVKGGVSSGNQIDAITGATLSSKGVTNGVNEVIEFFKASLSSKGGQK
jgi:electron transport complex protein RnfG